MKKLWWLLILCLGCQPPTNGTMSGLLIFTATGAHGYIGQASAYDVRYFSSPITKANWDSAYKYATSHTPKISGATDTITVTGLYENATYYFALKVGNDNGKWSEISNVVSATIHHPNQVLGVVKVGG